MINNLLNIKIKNVDVSSLAYLWENENISAHLTGSSDYIEVSYKKPLKQLYFDFQVGAGDSPVLTAETFKNGNWTAIKTLDETKGLKKSGFTYFLEDWELKDGEYKVRLSVNHNTGTMKIRGINLVFCNDNDLRFAWSGVSRFLPRDFNTQIQVLEEATRYITQKINNMGKFKFNGESVSRINRFDFLDITQIKEAAKFYALHTILLTKSVVNNPCTSYGQLLGDQ